MKQTKEPRIAIDVDEYYEYELDLGVVPVIELKSERGSKHGTIRVHVPYEGTLRINSSRMSDLAFAEDHKDSIDNVTSIEMSLPLNKPKLEEVSLPSQWNNQDLLALLKSGKYMEWSTTYEPDNPDKTLVSITGQITDSAGLGEDINEVVEFLSGKDQTFASDLYLQFKIWIPDLLNKDERQLFESRPDRILLPDISNIESLAQSMAALANSGGGQLVIGVDRHGRTTGPSDYQTGVYRTQVTKALIQAGLLCNPLFPLQQPDYAMRGGQIIVMVDIPRELSPEYLVKGQKYQRDGTKTVRGQTPNRIARANSLQEMDTELSIGSIEHALDNGMPDIVVLPSVSDNAICRCLSGMVNAQKSYRYLLRTSPPIPTQKPGLWERISNPQSQDTHKKLRDELAKCTPSLEDIPIYSRIIRDQRVDIIPLSNMPPVVIYEDQGYDWKDGELQPISAEDLFSRYTQRIGTYASHFGQVSLTSGSLKWYFQPPVLTQQSIERFNTHSNVQSGCYEPQTQKFTWESVKFVKKESTGGWSCSIVAPLRHILINIDDKKVDNLEQPELEGQPNNEKRVDDLEQKKLQGQLDFCLNDVLASGIQITSPNIISKRTHVRVLFKADAQELFKRRLRRSFMKFQLMNAALDNEHVNALSRTFSDLGFRLDAPQPRSDSMLFSGRQQRGFYDIALNVWVDVKATEVNRELRYPTYIEQKQTQLQTLNLVVMLSGVGKDVYSEMARLYPDMHRLLKERLRYLGTE